MLAFRAWITYRGSKRSRHEAALVAGGLAKLSGAERAEATDNTALIVGVTNTASVRTVLDRNPSAANPGNNTALEVNNSLGTAIFGQSNGAYGVNTPIGVYGVSSVANGVGVIGSGGQYGVQGSGSEAGVHGLSQTRVGVRGGSKDNVGVFGVARSFSPSGVTPPSGRVGVAGVSDDGTGVRGDSGDGNGVFGVSTNASGVYGFSNFSYGTAGVSNSYTGVYARSGAHWGLHAESVSSFAGVFSGPVYINGSMTATGAKSAAVKLPNGEHRRMYCQEAPEPWFEDFGKGQLAGGRATVALDKDFASVVKSDDYLVFLTEVGDAGGLYVSNQGPQGFEVRSRGAAPSGGAFNYRVVARRKDPVGGRLEKVDVPDFSKVKPLPTPPDVPTKPEEPGRPGR